MLDFGMSTGHLGCDEQVLLDFWELRGYGVGVFVQGRDYEKRYDTLLNFRAISLNIKF
jgi:hypothetical protein